MLFASISYKKEHSEVSVANTRLNFNLGKDKKPHLKTQILVYIFFKQCTYYTIPCLL